MEEIALKHMKRSEKKEQKDNQWKKGTQDHYFDIDPTIWISSKFLICFLAE